MLIIFFEKYTPLPGGKGVYFQSNSDKSSKHQQSIEELEEEKTKQLYQLKEFYEADKHRLESRINEERRTAKLKLDQQQEEYDTMLKEEQENHEEELEMLKDELKQIEENRNEEIKQTQQDLVMSQQKIQFLEQSLQDAKQLLSSYQKENSENLNIQLQNYRSKELYFSDREKDLERRNCKLEIENDDLKGKIETLKDEINQSKDTNQDLKDELVNQKIEFSRKESNIKEVLIKEYEERNNKLRFELLDEVNQKTAIYETEIRKLNEKNEKQALENKQLEEHLREFEEELDILEAENNELKSQLHESEREISEITSNYDRDKALWEEKFAFLENQKIQAKKDLQDAHKKFEMTVEQLQRKDSSERGKTESAQMLLISSIDKKYKDQIRDLNESSNQMNQENQLKIKQLEKENRELKEKYEIDIRGKLTDSVSMEKKIKELTEIERKLNDEIKMLKADRDKKCLENQANIEREKESCRVRIQELEHKVKNSESKRSYMIFEFEKEKAKWTLEKDKFISEIESLTENLKKAKRRKEALAKENEKLKTDFRNHRKFLHSSVMNSTTGAISNKNLEVKKSDSISESQKEFKPRSSLGKSPKSTKAYIGDFTTSRSKKDYGSKTDY